MLKRGLFMLAACAPLGLVLGGCPPTMDECTLDTDCTGDDICVDGSCVECEDDTDCAAGETCTDGTCGTEEPECTTNDDCDAGEVCEGGACVPDDGGNGGDPVAGQAFYNVNGCAGCHAADGTGGIGPNIQEESAADIFDNIAGDDAHPVKVNGATMEDAEDVAAWLASL